MTTRTLSALLAAAGIAAFAPPAQAAVTVLGSGPAEMCYRGADSGRSPVEDLFYCNQALAGALTPKDRAATFVNRGVLRLAVRDIDGAAADFDSALAIDAEIGEAYVDRGATLIFKKRYADAIKDIDKGLALGSKEPQNAYYDRAMAYEALGDLRAASNDHRQAVTQAPDYTAAVRDLARFKIVEKPSGT